MRDSPRRGWESEFADFCTAHQRLYLRIAYTILGSWPAAEDATQDAFTSIFRAWRSIKGPDPHPYARRVLVNTCLSHVRKRRTDLRLDLADAALPDPTEDRTRRIDLITALRGLDPTSRAVVALRYLHDLSVHEVALALDMPEGTVKSRCSRALSRLRQEMDDDTPPTASGREEPPARAATAPSPEPHALWALRSNA